MTGTPPIPERAGEQPAADGPKPRFFATQGCPPSETRFKPGVSGNPKGRPKGSKSLAALIDEALDDKISVTINGKTRRIAKRQVVARRIVDQAVKGDHKAIIACANIDAANEARKAQSNKASANEADTTSQDEEMLNAFIARLQADQEGDNDNAL